MSAKANRMNPVLNFATEDRPSLHKSFDYAKLISALQSLAATKALVFPKEEWTSYNTTCCNQECQRLGIANIRTTTRNGKVYVWLRG